MADKASATLEIQFGIESDTGDALALELDEDMNVSAASEPGGEPTVKTEFMFGDKAYLRLARPNVDPYEMSTTWGALKLEAEGVESKTPKIEDVVFAMTSSENLSSMPSSVQSWEWIGTDPGVEPEITLAAINLGQVVAGVLRVTYLVSFDRWSLKVDSGTGGLGTGDAESMLSLVIAVQEQQKATLSVSFSDGTGADGGGISLELDEDMNVEPADPETPDAEPTVKSEFAFGEKAYIRVMTASDEPYTMDSTGGTLRSEGSNIVSKTKTEQDVQFAGSSTGSLSGVPAGTPTWEWIGRNPGVSPLFDGANITLSEEVTAILKVYYNVRFDRWSLVVNEGIGDLGNPDVGPVPALVVATQEGQTGSLTVNFMDSTLGPEDYDVVVVWDCSENNPVPGALVKLGGQTFVTGADGSCAVGLLTPNKTYQISADKEGKSATYQVVIPEPEPDK